MSLLPIPVISRFVLRSVQRSSRARASSTCSLFSGLGEFGRFFLQAAGECGHAGLIKTGGHSRPRQTLR